ncbi:DNA polymerase III subunit delta' [Thermosulfurimonas marina]|uniref:DNA polymerase III subunit delta n=1 Tax=Thermosulfurimonas marina TaxID=2047767 RepID=A0A6H1WTD7_9BACT|nr:DNA polymerase III subunit delta' [Thermosulfurimonas marina]QJA06452.1 DNA polymerase III subunit delta' [Thermosulfurimonas marina]
MRLEDLRGQPAAVKLFRRALESGRLAHAYLLVGPEGTGKATAVRALVAELFCETGGACGNCRACRKLQRGTHPDFLVLSREGEKISIARVREAERFLRHAPLEAPAKVILVEEAERLTPEAANALLKSLEEPPPYAHFFLTALSTERLLPTIVSRSQVVRFRPLSPETLEELLRERFALSEEEARALALLSEGSPGRALQFSKVGLLEGLHRLVAAARSKDPGRRLRTVEDLAGRKDHLPDLLFLLRLWLWYSFLARRKLTQYPPGLPSPAPEAGALQLAEEVERIRQDLENYANVELSLLYLLFRLSEAWSGALSDGSTLPRHRADT